MQNLAKDKIFSFSIHPFISFGVDVYKPENQFFGLIS